jgi:hypothetical protein
MDTHSPLTPGRPDSFLHAFLQADLREGPLT